MCRLNIFLMKTIICLLLFVVYTRSAYSFSVNNSFINLRLPRQINRNNGCQLPPHPKLGQWSVYLSTSQQYPGMWTPLGTILEVSCQNSYKLDGEPIIVCIHGKWSAGVGQCLKTCPPIRSTSTMTVTCTFNNIITENCTNVLEGAVAKFKCADFYEDEGLKQQPFRLCQRGKWNQNIPECVPVCGRNRVKYNPTLIVNGSTVAKGEYPWQVAIYTKVDKVLICGGSLINQRVILTAAHCMTDAKDKVLSKELFIVAAGKYYRDYNDPREDKAQFSPLHQIFIPRQYKGDLQNFFGDIAVLITKETFSLSRTVQPVCMDWAAKYKKRFLDPTKVQYAYVSGWGYTVENKEPSNVLKKLKVPLVTETKCTQELEDQEQYLTDDKICAGYLNSGTSVCKGDSGGGLVFKHRNKFYLAAVVSLSAKTPREVDSCNSQSYGLYTKVYDYIESFILDKEAQFRPSNVATEDCDQDPNCQDETTTTSTNSSNTERPVTETPRNGCVLPQSPLFGQLSIFGLDSELVPGTKVSEGTTLRISCKKGYILRGNNVVLCERGEWTSPIGQCLRTCPPRFSTKTMTVNCVYENRETVNCTEPVDGTLSKFKCAPFYEDLGLKRNPIHICKDGVWDRQAPKCVPVCGQKTVDAQRLIVNGSPVTKGDYPWQVALYTVKDHNLICSGSLINQRVILTAAHCVTDDLGQIQSKELYVVAVGKYYRQFNDSRDFNEAQFSELHQIFIPVLYRGAIQNYLGDIAILVTKKVFILSRTVQPVCVDFGENYNNFDRNDFGYITGWGYTAEDAKPSDVLKEMKVPSVSFAQCRDSLPEDFVIYLTDDKLCAGYLENGTSVCYGDDGGGLVFKNDGRYYITGIMSLSPQSPTTPAGCDSQQYNLYTKVSNYINDFILKKESEFRP